MESHQINQQIAKAKNALLKNNGQEHGRLKATEIMDVPSELIGLYSVNGDGDKGQISLSVYSLADGYSREKYNYNNGILSGDKFEIKAGKIMVATAGPNNDFVDTLVPVALDKHPNEDLFVHLGDLDFTHKSDN